MIKSKLFVASALALVGVLGAGVARANHADVQWSVTIGTPVYPYPGYTQPAPVYQQHYYPQYPSQHYYPQHRRYQPQYGQPSRWDRDGDGIPNRRDPVYNPRWDRDGDGVPNRYDRDRDGDGIPNWQDRRDGGRYWRGR